MRTTISLDLPLVRQIKDIGREEHKTFARVVRDLLALALTLRRNRPAVGSPLPQWHSRDLGARIDYADKEALYKTLDRRP